MNSLEETQVSQIRDCYRAQLEVPNELPGRQLFVGMVCLVGAGKTTVITPLARQLGLVRLSSDEVRKLLKEAGLDYQLRTDILEPLAHELALKGYSLAFDTDCANPRLKRMIEDLAAEVGATVLWIHVQPPEDFILQKLRSFKHDWLFTDADTAIANYFSQKEKRAAENTPFDFFETIDTSLPSLQSRINTLAKRIRELVRR